LLVQAPKPSDQPRYVFVARALKAPSNFEEIIRRLLVLSADHGFDPTTYAVRAVANVKVTPYQAVTIGLIPIQGQRIQAERFVASGRFLEEILRESDGRAAAIR
jgi:citrate synthase